MKINYGLNRVVRYPSGKKKGIEHKNRVIDLPEVTVLNWTEKHEYIRDEIMKINPGWALSGYSPRLQEVPGE